MDLFKANVFKVGWLKQAKFFVSVPLQVDDMMLFSETGVVALEKLPLYPGFAVSEKAKMAWNVIQKLKIYLEGVGLVTPISERSRLPLDPYGILTEEEKSSLASLAAIHKDAYSKAFARLSDKDNQGPNERTIMTIIWILAVLIGIALIGLFIKG